MLPLKIARPKWFDGTALCIGSMAPDLAYPLGSFLDRQSHTALGVVTWGVACTFAVCFAIRRFVATTAFAHLPDAGPLRLHSFRVLRQRRPAAWQTLVSALVGAGTHVLIDGFTHQHRWGAEWAGFDEVAVGLPWRGEVTLARVFQYTGHTLGSLVGVLLLLYLARHRLLERWYGAGAVASARAFTLTVRARVVFWCVVGAGVPAGLLWAGITSGVRPFRVIDALAATTAIACLLPATRPREPVPSTGAVVRQR